MNKKLIKETRRAKNLTVEQLANLANVSSKTIQRYEDDNCLVSTMQSLDNIRNICKVLGLSLEEILENDAK